MAKAAGLGGAFLRADDPNVLYAWYEKHLGLKAYPTGGGILLPAGAQRAFIVVAFFSRRSGYFRSRSPQC